jgi:type II secretory pathway pseudopilin PulG
VILVVLLILAILSERASVALTSTLIDVTNSRKYRTEREIFAQAEAGLEEARARILATSPNFIGDPAPTPNPLWSAYILTSSSWKFSQDPTYDNAYTNYIPIPGSLTNTAIKVNGLQSNLPYWIKLRHKREYDAEVEGHKAGGPKHYFDGDGDGTPHTPANPGNILYYGFYPPGATKPVQFTALGTPNALPVELIRAYDSSSSKWIEVDAVREVGPPPLAPVYMKGNMVFDESATGTVNGLDQCGGGGSGLPPVYTGGTTQPQPPKKVPQFDGNPSTPQQGAVDIDLKGYIDKLKGGAITVDKDQYDTAFGSATNYLTVYGDFSKKPTGVKFKNVTGFGNLLIDGDLTLEDKITWNGLIIANGLLKFDALPGETNVRGAIWALVGDTQNKNPDLRYDSCELSKALGTQPLKFTRWKYRS